MIIKVKEPIKPEYDRIQNGQLIYTYFHLAAVPELARSAPQQRGVGGRLRNHSTQGWFPPLTSSNE